MKIILPIGVISCLLLVGCAPANIQELQAEMGQLETDLMDSQSEIESLKADRQRLQDKLANLENVNSALGTEKSSRVEESSALRGEVRKFVQTNIDNLKEFLVQGDLLDYTGGELVTRSSVSNTDNSMTLVDLSHPIPKPGVLTGVGAYFEDKGRVQVKVLRHAGDSLVLIWESPVLDVKQTGIKQLSFPVTVGVEQGDVIAYYFPSGVNVSYNEGTGNTRFTAENLTLGAVVNPNGLRGVQEKRAYSIGVYGLLH